MSVAKLCGLAEEITLQGRVEAVLELLNLLDCFGRNFCVALLLGNLCSSIAGRAEVGSASLKGGPVARLL
jgi:hypothetical protein